MMKRRLTLVLLAGLAVLSGCGGTTGTSSGGTGGATATGGTGGATATCSVEEQVPEGWHAALDPWSLPPATLQSLTTNFDEEGGDAAIGARLGPFLCPHDFSAVSVAYWTGALPDVPYTYGVPSVSRVAVVRASPDGDPAAAPFTGAAVQGTCTSNGSGSCKIFVDEAAAWVPVTLDTIVHVDPGDIIYPSVQVDAGVAVMISQTALKPNPGWFYSPAGSKAGGPSGGWAALDTPPPGVTPFHRAPYVRLLEVGEE